MSIVPPETPPSSQDPDQKPEPGPSPAASQGAPAAKAQVELPPGVPRAKPEPPKEEAVEIPATPPEPEEDPTVRHERRMRRLWTVGSVLSISFNIILCLVLIVLGNQLFALKKLVGVDLLGGLYANFVKMDQANITTVITVQEQIPIQFELPISQDTVVVLSDDAYIEGARVSLNTGGLVIYNAPTNIVLPKGTTLPIHLEMVVPVEQSIPITLKVPVDIPLDQTELHAPFTGLQSVVAPYYWLLKPEWQSCADVPVLGAGGVCELFFSGP